MKELKATVYGVGIILELLGDANPTWNDGTEKVYSLWQKLLEFENEAC